MADSTIGSLPAIQVMQTADLFVLEQNGVAKKLSGEQLSSFIDRQITSVEVVERAATETYTANYNADTGRLVLGIPRGVGIASITNPTVSGLNKTYTIIWEKPASASVATMKQYTVKDGNGIVSIQAVDDSHPHGGLDHYRINFAEGDPFDFYVYNGEDGVSSPGYATPLRDSATGAVGSSTNFARQDHIHPANAIKQTITIQPTSWVLVSGTDYYRGNITSLLSGITVNSKIDLQAPATTLAQMIENGTSIIFAENDNGAIFAYAFGEIPSAALEFQAVVTEVAS